MAGAPAAALAAVGDVIRTVSLPGGEGPEGQFCASGSGTSVAVVPGASVGLPLEPVLLVTTCNTVNGADEAQRDQESKLFFFRPSQGDGESFPLLTVETVQFDGEFSFPFAPPRGWGSLAMRTDKGDLIGCGNKFPDGESTHEIYRIPLSKSFAGSDGLPTTAPVRLFVGESGSTGVAFCDGVAWDTVENRIYQSPERFPTVYRFNETGTAVGTNITAPAGCNPGDSGVGRASGVAVSGQSLYLGCANDPEIYRVDKNTGAVLEFFGSSSLRTADLECDPVTFGKQQKDVLWTKGASDNSLIAVEVARGSCGGAVPVAMGPLCSSLADTDGDGLLDCWEQPSPAGAGAGGQPCIDFDGNGTCDLVLCVNSGNGQGTVCANPYRKDVFLEIDWLQSHRPNQFAINRVINRFDVAPVANPVNPATGTSVSGIRLHVQVDPEALKNSSGTVISHTSATNHLLTFEPYTAGATGVVNALDFDQLKQNNFGISAAERANPTALDAKRQAFRYMIFGHFLAGLGGSSGAAEVHGNDGVVTLGAGAVVLGHAVGSEDQQAGTFFHELGHLLGLRHGGGDFVGCKPNYLSVMNYTRQLPGAPIPTAQWRGSATQLTALDFSRDKLADLNKNTLDESAGVKSPGGLPGDVTAFGPGSGVVRSTAGAIDWNRSTTTSGTPISLLQLNRIVNTSGTLCEGDGPEILEGYNDWANLRYDVRSSLDIADGIRLSLIDKEAELGFQAPPDNPCAVPGSCPVVLTTTDEGLVDSDGDTKADLEDNCPTVANMNQADTNGDGIGNACAETAVAIDIRPLKYPNTVKVNSIFPLAVAILGAQGFNATQVKPETVRLASAKVIRVGNVYLCGPLDVNRDGRLDLVCIVDKRDLVLPADDAVAVLTAKTHSNVSIRGEDSIHIIRGKSHHDDD